LILINKSAKNNLINAAYQTRSQTDFYDQESR